MFSGMLAYASFAALANPSAKAASVSLSGIMKERPSLTAIAAINSPKPPPKTPGRPGAAIRLAATTAQASAAKAMSFCGRGFAIAGLAGRGGMAFAGPPCQTKLIGRDQGDRE